MCRRPASAVVVSASGALTDEDVCAFRWWVRSRLATVVTVIVYSPAMTENRPELPGSHWNFETAEPVVAQ